MSEDYDAGVNRFEPMMAGLMIAILTVAGVAIGVGVIESVYVGLICAGVWILWRLKATGGVLN